MGVLKSRKKKGLKKQWNLNFKTKMSKKGFTSIGKTQTINLLLRKTFFKTKELFFYL